MMVSASILNSILGINRRNLDVIAEYNPRHYFPLVDDKITTKQILEGAGIPVPSTIAIAESFFDIDRVLEILAGETDFVIKPARGRAGGGVLLAETIGNKLWSSPSGRKFSHDNLRQYLGDILFGVYSFGKMGDRVLVEKRIIPHEFMTDIYPVGIADIRVITFKKKAVMAMIRIPTSGSDGKANIHQGAIGVSLEMDSGRTGNAVHLGKSITEHPDSGAEVSGLKIPYWKEILLIAESASREVPLDYIGVDIVLDKNLGPNVLELNARPGLQIQVVNRKGLIPLLTESEE